MAAKWAYCREHGLTERDPRIQRSDWLPWLESLNWYDVSSNPEESYATIVEHLLRPREERRRFFQQILKEKVRPSTGYEALAQLVARGWIRTVLTTNFDDMIPQAFHGEAAIAAFDVIKTPLEAAQISTDPIYPQVIFIHGAVEHYTDQNLEDETEHLRPELKSGLLPLLRDHPLIVVGYRGGENSVMIDLLEGSAEAAMGYRHGVYWCMRRTEIKSLHPFVIKLADRVGENFELVPIEGFDECMWEWNRVAGSALRRPEQPSPRTASSPSDLQVATDVVIEDLDWQLIEDRVSDYAIRLSIDLPASPDRVWIQARLEEANLLARIDGSLVPTQAAVLLFSKGAPISVEVEFESEKETIDGNLVTVLDRVIDSLGALNEPFRLKGPTSVNVYSFPPTAIKELVVNALVHRDYSMSAPIRIVVTDVTIRVISPGGVVADLDPDRLGQRGIRSYRNPVIANFMFGIGAVDKAGSGLADVRRWSEQNNGSASFGPVRQNIAFVATLHARPERPDLVTGTADPSPGTDVFRSNLLPITIDGRVHRASTEVESAWDILDAHPGEELPPFVLRPGELISFTDLSEPSNPLAEHVTGPVNGSEVGDLIADPDDERLLVQLLNRTLFRYARAIKLEAVPWDNRIYYPSAEDEARKVTYRARMREATRTVAKPIVARTSGKTRYWEHHAMRFQYRRFGRQWGLLVVPGWVFTTDGFRDILRGPRVGPLSTRRSARDYNPNVANHLNFWAWTLCQGLDEVTLPGGAVKIERGFLSRQLAGSPPVGDDDGLVEESLEDEIADELAAIAAEQIRERDDEA